MTRASPRTRPKAARAASRRSRSTFPWLVADIGGTNARFGLVHGPDLDVQDIVTMPGADFPGPSEAASAYLEQVRAGGARRPRPQRAAFAIATPITGDTIKLTNSRWIVAKQEIEAALGVHELRLLNDFEVLAHALPHLRTDDVVPLGGPPFDRQRPMAVIGPGTGLGVAACVPHAGGWIALPGEGGHVTAAAADDFESDVLRALRAEFDHVSAERVLAGIGLAGLHRAVARVRGTPVETLTPEEITRRALEANAADCTATLDVFCAMLGTFAGNVALTVGARGGVFIAGGIAQKLRDLLPRSRFRARFEAKGRFASYMAGIGTGLIVAPAVAMTGAARALAGQPERAAAAKRHTSVRR